MDITPLLKIATDCLRFVTEFFDVIHQSGSHIYHSALLLAPQSSVVRTLYSQHICSPVSKVVTGIPASWDSCTASAGAATEILHAAWSPCGHFIGAVFGNTVQIRDSKTLEKVSVLKPYHSHMGVLAKFLTFSPNGHLLACIYEDHTRLVVFPIATPMLTSTPRPTSQSPILVWDVQTGVIISDFQSWGSGELVFSGNHRTITLLGRDGTFRTYDTLKGISICMGIPAPSSDVLLGAHWVHEESLQFSTSFRNNEKRVVNIQELQPTSTPLFPLIQSFHLPPCNGQFSFSPISFHGSFVTEAEVIILSVQDLGILLQVKAAHSYIPPGHFSPDGSFFACRTEEHEICVWKNTSTGYVPWSKLRPQLPFKGFSFSPTMSSILTWGPEGIQLLHPDNHPTIPSPDKLEHCRQCRNHIVAYSTDGVHIAVARKEDNIVMVLDTRSNAPQRFINTDMQVLDIKIIDNTIFVAGGHGLVKWDLEAGEPMDDDNDSLEVSDDDSLEVAGDQIISIATPTSHIAISDDCSQIAFTEEGKVFLCNIQAQRTLFECVALHSVKDIRFSPDGHRLWFITDGGHSGSITLVKLERGEDGNFASVTTKSLRDEWPWVDHFSPHGWHVGSKSSEWVEDSKGNKLLWLPLSWRAKGWQDVRWDGNFLAFVHHDHLDPIIIEFQP
jgi:WD40 repeat protein